MSDISRLLDKIEDKIENIDKLLRPIRTKMSNKNKDLEEMLNWLRNGKNNVFITIQNSNSYDTEDIYNIKFDKKNINILNKSNTLVTQNLLLAYIIENTNNFFNKFIIQSLKNSITHPKLCIYQSLTIPISIHYNFETYIQENILIFSDTNKNQKLLSLYKNIINVRGNGACFYRAVLYSLFISLYQHDEIQYVFKCLDYLQNFFNDSVFNDFFNKFKIIISKKLPYIYLYILYSLYDLLLIVKCKIQLITIIEHNLQKTILENKLEYYVNKIVSGKTILEGLRYQNEYATDMIILILPYILGCGTICVVKSTNIECYNLKNIMTNIEINIIDNKIQQTVLPNINIFHIGMHFLTIIPNVNDFNIISQIKFDSMDKSEYIKTIISKISNKVNNLSELLNKLSDKKYNKDLIILLIKEYFNKFKYPYFDITTLIQNIKGFNINTERVIEEVFKTYIKKYFIDKKDKVAEEIDKLLQINNRNFTQKILLNAFRNVLADYRRNGLI